jgi:hypothetical protein
MVFAREMKQKNTLHLSSYSTTLTVETSVSLLLSFRTRPLNYNEVLLSSSGLEASEASDYRAVVLLHACSSDLLHLGRNSSRPQ